MKRGRNQLALGSLMILIAVCAIAFASQKISLAMLVFVIWPLDYLDRKAARNISFPKASEAEKLLVANSIDASGGR